MSLTMLDKELVAVSAAAGCRPCTAHHLAEVRRAGATGTDVEKFDTLRLRLVKIAARVVEMKTQIKIHLPTSAPDQAIIHLGRLPRLIT